MSSPRAADRPAFARHRKWFNSRSRAGQANRLAGPERLESRCLLSASAEPAATLATFFDGYLTVHGIYQRMDQVAAAYPTLAELIDYGDSYSKTVGGVLTPGGRTLPGYDLLALKITNQAIAGPKPVFFLMANVHAREIATPEIALRFADWLTSGYGRDADATWLVDQHEIWILPTANPDGHWYVELGTQAPNGDQPWMWRKNGHAYEPAAWPPTAFDHYGVDLNRNFDFHWGTAGATEDTRAQTYPGPAAASEPETRALQELLARVFADQRGPADADVASDTTSGIFVSLHQQGELVLWPWWDTDSAAPNAAGLEAIGRKFASYNGYTAGSGAQGLYQASGTVDDWVYGTLGVPGFTFEMAREFMPWYPDIDETLWPENAAALVYAARLARTPYVTVLGPDAGQVAIERTNTGLTVSATIDDTANGGQALAGAEYYVDVPPWDHAAIPQVLAAGDGSFDSPREQVNATLAPEGLAAGRHVIYVRGQDSLGNWGPFSAGLLEFRPWQNADNPFDVDGLDGVTVADALVLINAINRDGVRPLPALAAGFDARPPFFDVTGDNWLTPDDVLRVINQLNAQSIPAGEAGEGEAAPTPVRRPAVVAADLLLADWAEISDAPADWTGVKRDMGVASGRRWNHGSGQGSDVQNSKLAVIQPSHWFRTLLGQF